MLSKLGIKIVATLLLESGGRGSNNIFLLHTLPPLCILFLGKGGGIDKFVL
jgi:hypothetical protein